MMLQRVTIGFLSSQVLAVRIADDALDALLQALGSAEWHDLTVDDGTVRLNLAQVVYVRTERDEHRVGFGTS
ncbi:MAG TPA: hypothetical protein VM299_06760 [Solirubrobacteraceae bacterium]|jgi:hypothetical protein|nr:hypothetical protein [Solirubrobacteraceae bacterium]